MLTRSGNLKIKQIMFAALRTVKQLKGFASCRFTFECGALLDECTTPLLIAASPRLQHKDYYPERK